MKIQLGVKTDPIETRYSFEWLFDLMAGEGISFVQLGSFFELYHLDDDYFVGVRQAAESRGLKIKSVFTAHRELGGFFCGCRHMEKVARRNYERLIQVASLVGADYCGSNPGAVYRDRPETKEAGTACYLAHMKELMSVAKEAGLKALTMEPMSCMAEPPSTPEEMDRYEGELLGHHGRNPGTTVPVYLCGDISHGIAGPDKKVVHGHMELFKHGLPYMAEFHFKNTDAIYQSTFGFSSEERARGVVDLGEVLSAVEAGAWPVADPVGYLEIGGPKIGRDYSDPALGAALRDSLRFIKGVFAP